MEKTVLIVDDSTSMRQLVSFTLKDAGYNVIEASDGRDALNKINGSKISLVITDLNMPGMDGISFIKALRNQPNFRFTPIIMLTTESQEAKKAEGRRAGASGWIVKPFTPEQLIEIVKKFVR